MYVSNKSIDIKNASANASLKSALGVVLLSSSLVSVANASPWPVAVVDKASAVSQQTIDIPVIANDIGTGLQIIQVNTTTKRLGRASINSGKQAINYRSASGFVGEDSFWYAFKDSQGRTNSAKVTINVTAQQPKPPQWPKAVNESPQVKYNTPTVIAVLANDNGVGLTIKQVNTSTVKGGKVSISSDGKKVVYTPPKDFSGNDEFWYVFEDAWSRTNAGKVTPVVKNNTSSPWPTATPDSASTVSPNSVLIPVLNNDIGEGLKLKAVNATTVKLGKASIVGSSIRYVPRAGFTGQDSFWYSFEDVNGRANSTQVFVDVKTGNAQLSSIQFCGANYFTDGTAANTNTSNNALDPNRVQLDTNANVEGFTSPAGAFATIGNDTYKLLTDATKGKRVVLERGGQVVAVIKDWEKGEIYGVGVRNNTFYFAFVPANQPPLPSGVSTNAKRTILLGHKAGSAINTLGSYLVQTPIVLMANQQSTLVRFEGYQYTNDGLNVVNPNPTGLESVSSYNYHEIPANGNKAVYLGDYTYITSFGSSAFRYTQEKLFSYNQNLISGIDSDTGQGAGYDFNKLIRVTNSQGSSDYPGNIDRAVLSNNRLLLTTAPHTRSFGLGGGGGTEDFPAKLYSFDSINSYFVELATCN